MYCSQDGVLYKKETKEIYIVPINLSGDIVIFEGVTTIEAYEFLGRSNLTSVVIPNSVTSIRDAAFGNCSRLTSVLIGASRSQQILENVKIVEQERLTQEEIAMLESILGNK